MNERGSILVVEDDPGIAASLEMILGDEGYAVTTSSDGSEGLRVSETASFDLVMTDFRLPGMGGLELMEKLRESNPHRPVILMTAHGNTDLAIEATKRGAFDYLLKPFDLDELLDVTAKAVQSGKSAGRRVRLGDEATQPGEVRLLGNCRAMQRVYKEIGRVAPTDATVLILGETGTGKELVARAIYQHSQRNQGPFVAVNCGAIPENLLESELFGHVRGAFTGATRDRVGRFEQARQGTLFLDEIGDLPLPVQVKLLRVLQERRIQPLGSNREVPVDVRIVAATHQPLAELIEQKRFREDLFYRINSAVIELPPLRDRDGDLEALASHFLAEAAVEFGYGCPPLRKTVVRRLRQSRWAGNVRELRNTIRQLVLSSRGYEITEDVVEALLNRERGVSDAPFQDDNFSEAIVAPVRAAIERARERGKAEVYRDLVGRLERQMIESSLQLSDHHLGLVCEWLGISRVTLRKKMAEFGIGKSGGADF